MESNKQECITPGGTHFSVNPPASAASGTRILEVPTTMEMNLSEDNKLLGGDPEPSKLSKKRKSYTAAEQAVMKYKNNLRKAKFYLEKSKQTELAGETPNEFQERQNAWALDILSNEERRKKENLTYKMFCCPKSSAIEKDTSQDDILPPPCKRASYDSAASTSASKKDPSQDDILPPPCKRALHDSSPSTSASKKDPSQDDVFLPPCKRASYDSAVTISENSSSFSVYRKRGKYTKKAESTESGKSDYASSALTSSKSCSDEKAGESNKYELKSSYVQCGENAARDTAKLQPIKSGKSDYPSSIPTSSKAATDEKARASNKPAVKSIDKLPFREIAKMNLKVSIVDANAPDLKMNVNNFSLVENRIQEEMFKLICENASASIAFQMKERYKGFRIINCETKESLDFLKCTVAKMGEIWPNAKLEVRHLYQLSAGPTVKMNLPMGKMNAKLIAALLLMNNKDLPVQNWKLVAYGKSFEGRIPVTFRIDDESLAIIKKKGFEVNFGIRSVMVKLSKSNIESEMERGIVGVDEIQNNTVPDISSLYNEGLELDREVEL